MKAITSKPAKRLQWGHDPQAVEDCGKTSTEGLSGPASMGPRPAGRGRLAPDGTQWDHSVKLQWGHDLQAVENSDHYACKGNLKTLQWGHDLQAVEDAVLAGFLDDREKASMGPRPAGRGRRSVAGRGGVALAREKASMGPRPAGRGRPRCWRIPAAARSGFNGATTCRPWKTSPIAWADASVVRLQWGHDLQAVEDTDGGNSGASPYFSLQWGHDLQAVEDTRPSAWDVARAVALQWGHDLQAVEDAARS